MLLIAWSSCARSCFPLFSWPPLALRGGSCMMTFFSFYCFLPSAHSAFQKIAQTWHVEYELRQRVRRLRGEDTPHPAGGAKKRGAGEPAGTFEDDELGFYTSSSPTGKKVSPCTQEDIRQEGRGKGRGGRRARSGKGL